MFIVQCEHFSKRVVTQSVDIDTQSYTSGFGVAARGIMNCGVTLLSLGGVGTGCCVVRRRRCGLASDIPRKHQYTRGRSSLKRYNTQQRRRS
jgi:hypothetical protein